jgi:23S rRNA (pseudouridine1915-N3)-methyltransferase
VKITILVVGKTDNGFIYQGVEEYLKRLKRYVRIEVNVIQDIKNSKSLSIEQLIQKEEDSIVQAIGSSNEIILLDERGKEYTSVELSQMIESKMVSGTKDLVFLIGGAYGVSDTVKKRIKAQMAVSKMTYSHQMVRLILVEQLYRAMTIIRGEPYHHE